MFALGPYLDKAGLDWVGPIDQIIVRDTWAEILAELKGSNGHKARAVVIPDGTLQYFPHSDMPRGYTSGID
jgi:hypothetical protein